MNESVTHPGRGPVLIVSPTPTHPAHAGNSVRIRRLIETLEGIGWEPHLLYTDIDRGDRAAMGTRWGGRFHHHPYRRPWNKLRLGPLPIPDRWAMPLVHKGWFHMGIDHWYDPSLDEAIAAWFRRHPGRTMIVEYAFLSRAFLAAPRGTLRILDTHDILGNRHQRLLAAGLAPDWFFTSPAEEARGLRRAHRVLAIQHNEARYFGKIIGDQRVFTVGHLLDLHEPEALPREPGLLFLASANSLNRDALRWFLAEVWPAVLRAVPEAKLHLVGSCGLSAPVAGVIDHGLMPDATAAYRLACIAINPIRAGSGLKIKTIEAMAHGRAVVTTPVGAEGLEDAGEPLCICSTPEQWIKRLVGLLENGQERLRLAAMASAYAQVYRLSQVHSLEQALTLPAAKSTKA